MTCRSGSPRHAFATVTALCNRWSRQAAPTVLSFVFAASVALAQVTALTAPITDPALEARVKTLSSELRCLVCQNQTVADSDAPVARDMREQVRAQLAAGKSEDEVKRYMTERFGDFVLYKPPLKASTLMLWLAPFAALAIALIVLTRRLKSNGTNDRPISTLTDAERERARDLLKS
jgi:cytochrome c-type biogenesis protein CcmH